jgi:hypothetical protein
MVFYDEIDENGTAPDVFKFYVDANGFNPAIKLRC